jgi:hypothetical protein
MFWHLVSFSVATRLVRLRPIRISIKVKSLQTNFRPYRRHNYLFHVADVLAGEERYNLKFGLSSVDFIANFSRYISGKFE